MASLYQCKLHKQDLFSKCSTTNTSLTSSVCPELLPHFSCTRTHSAIHQLHAHSPSTTTMAPEASRPLLLPQNRRIRHLQGIYVRNITLHRPRGQTIDDAVLDKTPQKLEALRNPQLPHAQSSSDLRSKANRARRSSSGLAAASPSLRQSSLENVIESRTADTFFTLHSSDQDEPIYISEVVEKATNPTFRFFELSDLGPATKRLNTVIVKVWVKRQDWVPLTQEEVNLQSLQYIGKLEHHGFPPNCLVFHLTDGIYTIDLKADRPPRPKSTAAKLPTSSYSALMRLSNLDESIQDALATQQELARQINNILASRTPNSAPQAREEVHLAHHYVSTSQKQLTISQRRLSSLKTSLSTRRAAIEAGRKAQAQSESSIQSAQDKLQSCRSLQTQTLDSIRAQRRRICEELLQIYPIIPTSSPLLFTIRSLPLPNTIFDDPALSDPIASALGHVSHVLHLLQFYLSVPLPYPITPFGSRSSIHDPISLLPDASRHFPLYIKGAVRFRLDYGVFLLNKDIEALAESQGLKTLDIRQTLPNLCYLLYVCSAGAGELPERKAGGVRGLLGLGSAGGSAMGSRRGSDESVTGMDDQADAARSALKGPVQSGSLNGNGAMKELPLPFGSGMSTSLRTSGMRENVT